MHYQGNIIRPPSEADSILLQVTVGCSHNKCTFCGTYMGERFTIKKNSIVFEDIDYAAKYFKRQNRVFICDGDALIIPQKRLVPILKRIQERIPWVERIGLYGNTKSIKMKTHDELKELKKLGVKIVYMGVETGDDVTLKKINKGADSNRLIEMGKKVKKTGIKLSITVLVGLAGRKRSSIHALETGKVLSAIDPDYVGALSLMLIPGTPLYNEYKSGEFVLITPDEMLNELGLMIGATNLTSGFFHANHASNYLPIRAKLPQDKEKTLAYIAKALEGKVDLKPEFMRAL
ncbi:MAG: radical SAM protein [Desulfobacteraceae bacterium 4572_130]|nr:MAG: radical SAM protein [Desulfobacteraceae bacterium 4572_130]